MSNESKVLWAVLGTLALVLGILFLPSRVKRELRPEPVRAFVAIQVGGEQVAREGRVEVAAGRPFRLHAVLEAAGRSGRRVFFTEAPGLELDGERVPGRDVRAWPGPEKAKVLWFSVEGARPFIELPEEAPLASVVFQEIFRPDWPRAWSIPGSVWPARQALADSSEGAARLPFGTQRYRVRIELFGRQSALVPVATYDSPSAGDLAQLAASFPTVVAALDGPLALPSRVFGLAQIGFSGAALQREAETLRAWYQEDLVFAYVGLLRAMADRVGVSWEDLAWRPIDLAAGPNWSPGSISAGDLLRAGERVVVLYEDRGESGVLDYEDLCFDYREGAKVLPLRDVFSGEGLVDWTKLRRTGTKESPG